MLFESIISYIVEGFNLPYIITINVFVYLIIKGLQKIKTKDSKKKFNITKFKKILLTILITAIFAVVYYNLNILDIEKIINSSVLAPVAWDWIIKPICKFIKIDYKKEDLL